MDGLQGTRYSFTFNKNPFFDNQVRIRMRTGISDVLTRRRTAQVIFKEFKYNKETGDLVVDTSPINWKDGCNLTLKVRFSSSPCPSFASRDRSSLLAAVAGRLCLVPPPPLRPSHLAPSSLGCVLPCFLLSSPSACPSLLPAL